MIEWGIFAVIVYFFGYFYHQVVIDWIKDDCADTSIFLLLNFIPMTWFVLDISLIGMYIYEKKEHYSSR